MKTLHFLILAITILISNSVIAQILTAEEKEGILLMREEEKLAHDVYKLLYEKWNLPIFNNISRSEARHIDAVGFLIERYGLKDPAINVPGKFHNNELHELYKNLTEKGSKSLVAALEVGAFIEEVDIKDLQELINQTSNETIKTIYGNLLWASGNHLRAFTGQLAFRNKPYSPVILGEGEYEEIISSPHQRARGYGYRNGFRGGRN